jgi:hypothetical protein
MELTINPAGFDGARSRWLAGLCPCCGSEVCEYYYDGTMPEAIGEGVMICGQCIANRHVIDPEFRAAMLAAILPVPGAVR